MSSAVSDDADAVDEDELELCRLLVVEFWLASCAVATLLVVIVTWCAGTDDLWGFRWFLRKRRRSTLPVPASEVAVSLTSSALSATGASPEVSKKRTKLRKLSTCRHRYQVLIELRLSIASFLFLARYF